MIEQLERQIEDLLRRVEYLEAVEKMDTDYYLQVARGQVVGAYALNKFGRNPDIDAGTEDVWDAGGTWAAPTTARVHNIKSSNANDTSAGTGARTISITGLNGSYAETTETVTLNGTTDVPTANSYVIIYRMRVTTAGSGATNAGNITATAVTDATVTAQITTGYGQTLMAIWQCPGSYSLYMTGYHVNSNATTAAKLDIVLWVKPFGEIWQVKHTGSFDNSVSGGVDYQFQPPFKITEKSLVRIAVTSSANNQDVTATFDGVYIAN